MNTLSDIDKGLEVLKKFVNLSIMKSDILIKEQKYVEALEEVIKAS